MKHAIDLWIKNFVEKPNIDFGNLPVCPYAKEARISKRLNIIEFNNDRPDEDIAICVKEMDLSKHDITLLIFEKDRWSIQETFKVARKTQKLAEERGLVFVEDHPEWSEVVGNTDITNGEYIIFFMQNHEKTFKYASKLRKTDYYKVWKKTNNEVKTFVEGKEADPDYFTKRQNAYNLEFKKEFGN